MYSRNFKSLLFASFSCIALLYSGKTHADQCYETNACSVSDRCGKISVYGEFLYWKVAQDQMQYAGVLPGGIQSIIQDFQNKPLQISERISIIDPSFDFKPGFRIGAGYEVPCSNWGIDFAWTRIHENATSSVYDDDHGVIPLTSPVYSILNLISSKDPSQLGFGSGAKAQWNFQFDTWDLKVGRICSFTDSLDFRPYIGVKGASIRQNQQIDYFGFSPFAQITDLAIAQPDATLRNIKKNNFYGVGPSFGFESSWEICPHWNLSSGICGALLYGKFDINERPKLSIDDSFITLSLKNSKKNRLRPAVDANIGIDWDTGFCDSFQIKVGVAYEVQYWWNQWQAPASDVSSLISGGNSSQGDLMMQGLTASLDISF